MRGGRGQGQSFHGQCARAYRATPEGATIRDVACRAYRLRSAQRRWPPPPRCRGRPMAGPRRGVRGGLLSWAMAGGRWPGPWAGGLWTGGLMDGRPVDRRPVDGPVDEARMAPAMPACRAAPAEPAPPRVAAPVPARASPGRIVPAVPPAAPDKLRGFDRRALGQRGRRRERAGAKRGLGGKGGNINPAAMARIRRACETWTCPPKGRLWTRRLNAG